LFTGTEGESWTQISKAQPAERGVGQTMVAVIDVKMIAQGNQVITLNSRLPYTDGIITFGF